MTGTVDTLRRASALMRERAAAATPGPWTHFGDHLVWPGEDGPASNDPILATIGQAHDDSTPHIASWHPAVARAVAKLLDDQADLVEDYGDFSDIGKMGDANALGIARAYLGEVGS